MDGAPVDDAIAVPVQHQRRHVQRRQHVAHVDVEEHLDHRFDAVGAHRRAAVAAEPFACGRILVERRRPHVDVATGVHDRHDQLFGGFGEAFGRRSPRVAGCLGRAGHAAVQHERLRAFRIRRREQDRHRHALRDAHEHGALGADRVHHRAHVVHPFLERDRSDVAIGETEAALVEADQTAERRQPAEEAGDRRVLPLDVEMAREPLHQHQVEVALAEHLVRDVHVPALRVQNGGGVAVTDAKDTDGVLEGLGGLGRASVSR